MRTNIPFACLYKKECNFKSSAGWVCTAQNKDAQFLKSAVDDGFKIPLYVYIEKKQNQTPFITASPSWGCLKTNTEDSSHLIHGMSTAYFKSADYKLKDFKDSVPWSLLQHQY